MTPGQVRLYRNDERVASLESDHRGIAYGDGLFETMRAHAGQVHWWDAHWNRLAQGSARLRIPLPDSEFVRREARDLLVSAASEDVVLKLVLSRGAGGRGYATAPNAGCTWQLAVHPLPVSIVDGLALRWCQTRLAHQALLAGLKHCNRLEQVMARLEWSDADARHVDADEGLMLDQHGDVVCATAANLFVLQDGKWVTPMLDRCGVAGVCRAWAIDALGAAQARITPAELEAADAIFLCNAVRGILPVARLGQRRWASHPEVVHARRLLASAHPAFASPDTESP